jgi:putative ABC transport system substrate-binding protein
MRSGRRRVLGVIGGSLAVAAVPLAAAAQPARRPYYRIGFLGGGDALLREFIDGMRDLGYEEDRHYSLATRNYHGDRSRIPALADELIALRPDVVVANVSSTAAVLKSKSATIPIVMATAIDPVAEGLADSLARPGGNVTGLTSLSQELHAKLVEFTHLLLPKAKRLAFVVNPDHVLAKSHHAVAARAARSLGIRLVPIEVRAAWDLESLADKVGRAQADALIVSADAVLFGLREGLVKAGLAAGVPTISVLSEFAEPGALATYGHDVKANFRRSARYVDRILKGAKPGELPIEQPSQFELVVNLRTAKALRISIPQAVLLRADRVVE